MKRVLRVLGWVRPWLLGGLVVGLRRRGGCVSRLLWVCLGLRVEREILWVERVRRWDRGGGVAWLGWLLRSWLLFLWVRLWPRGG